MSLQWPNGNVDEMKFISYKEGVFQFEQGATLANTVITKKDGENPEGKCDFFKSGPIDWDRTAMKFGPGILEFNGNVLTAKENGQVFGTWNIEWNPTECSVKGKIVQHLNPKAVGQLTEFKITDIKGKTATFVWRFYSTGEVKLLGQGKQ
ncbi:MAG TPA: hypothetical protein PL048_15250 [Leptospiraceae bacterium]|nr:hypothetical protein [Leptospiraceae bacterium]HMZ60131.1 hypothetical protein [Leptospiraceae bacterium]HNF17255.1 hypothetical protein [Leptospiraceae bacterium]HNF27818.1 hypothetical protein [Leptospiraceae bacterium]HNH09054.1 hypothetical protein [Leptospiraceae bacterium]